MSDLDLSRVNTLWFVTLGLTSLVGAILAYYLTLESALGAFSIHEAYPSHVQEDGPSVALLRSGYTKQAYRALTPGDSALWVDASLRSWRHLLLDRSRGIRFSEVSDADIERGVLDDYDLLILPSTSALSDREIDRIKAFVHDGGSVLASFAPGIYYPDGTWRGWSFLEDLFGLAFVDFVDRSAGSYRAYQDTFPGTTPPGLYQPKARFGSHLGVPDSADTSANVAPSAPDSLPSAPRSEPDLWTLLEAETDTARSPAERLEALRARMRHEADRAAFAPLRGYVWSDSLGGIPPQSSYALADTLTTTLRDLDGTLRRQAAVVVRYYTWLGTDPERQFPYPQTGTGIRRFTFRASTPLTAGIPPGYRVKVQVYDGGVRTRVLEPRTKAAGFWYDFAVDPSPVDDALATTTGIAYGTYGLGRFVYLGFPRDAMGIGRDDPEDLQHLGVFFANALDYLRRQPVVWTHPWPAPHETAAVLSGLGTDSLDHFGGVDDLLQRAGMQSTYFVRPEDAYPHRRLLERLHARGAVGVLDDLRHDGDGPFSFQQERLALLKRQLEGLVDGTVEGYRPTEPGALGANTMGALKAAGYRFFLADSLDRQTSPTIIGYPYETLTRIGITARSDHPTLQPLAGEPPGVQAAPFLEDLRRVQYEGSLYHLVFHDDGLGSPHRRAVLDTVAHALKASTAWVTTAGDLVTWHRQIRALHTNAEQRGPNRLIIRISNDHGTPIEFAQVRVALGRRVGRVDISSELVQVLDPVVPDYTLSDDGMLLTLSFRRIKPQQALVYRIDLLDEAGRPILAYGDE